MDKIKHIQDCRAIANGKTPTHMPASTYNASALAGAPLAAHAAGGIATGFAQGWARAKAKSDTYKRCMSGLGYKFAPLNEKELAEYKYLSTDEKAQYMERVYKEILEGKRKENKL